MNLQLAVLWCGGRWTLLAPGARYDRYMSRQSALDAAHRLADQARRQGHEVEVLIQDIGGELSPVPLDDLPPAKRARPAPPRPEGPHA
jgi:hypothetical protein